MGIAWTGILENPVGSIAGGFIGAWQAGWGIPGFPKFGSQKEALINLASVVPATSDLPQYKGVPLGQAWRQQINTVELKSKVFKEEMNTKAVYGENISNPLDVFGEWGKYIIIGIILLIALIIFTRKGE